MTDLDNNLLKFEEYYRYLESSFISITRIIPLENTPDTFSPRLYEILQSVCSQVDGILKLMHSECMPTRKETTAAVYGDLNQEGVFNYQTLVYKSRPDWNEIKSFSCKFRCVFLHECDESHGNGSYDRMPKWWKAYNDSKHNLPEGYDAGSIENTYLALASLYTLHVMMRQYPRNKNGFLKRDTWKPNGLFVLGRDKKHFTEPITTEPSSEIFISCKLLIPPMG